MRVFHQIWPALVVAWIAVPASAQSAHHPPSALPAAAERPVVVQVPVADHPPVPPWLKVACMVGPDVITASPTCPVIRYKGITTWAFSFVDNRVAFAFVSYDAQNRIVDLVTKDGARYVWKIDDALTVFGQSNDSVTLKDYEVSRGIGMDNHDVYAPPH